MEFLFFSSYSYEGRLHKYFTNSRVDKNNKQYTLPPMPKEHELIDIEKGGIVALKPHFLHAEIGDQLDIDRSTVTKFLERFHTRQSIKNLPRSGRPQKTSETEDR